MRVRSQHSRPPAHSAAFARHGLARVTRIAVQIGDASDIEAYRGYLKVLRARAAELKKDGKSADEASKTLVDEFRAKYPGWAQPARVAAGVAAVYRELP